MTRYEERRMARHVYAVGLAVARVLLALDKGDRTAAEGVVAELERDYLLLAHEAPPRGVRMAEVGR